MAVLIRERAFLDLDLFGLGPRKQSWKLYPVKNENKK